MKSNFLTFTPRREALAVRPEALSILDRTLRFKDETLPVRIEALQLQTKALLFMDEKQQVTTFLVIVTPAQTGASQIELRIILKKDTRSSLSRGQVPRV